VRRANQGFLFIVLLALFVSCGGDPSSSSQDIESTAKRLKKNELSGFTLVEIKSLIKGTSDYNNGGLLINDARLALAVSLIKEGKSLDEAIVQSQEELERKNEMDHIKDASPERRKFDRLTDGF